MSADQVIQQIRTLSKPEELDEVGKALEEHRNELLADQETARRIAELESGKVKGLSENQVFEAVRTRIRAG